MSDILTLEHPRWPEFAARCDREITPAREASKEELTRILGEAVVILEEMGGIDLENSLLYFCTEVLRIEIEL
jgi:hypothetical protein